MPTSEDFLDRLTLARTEADTFVGHCHSGAPLRAFGGQIAAQALMAAGQTVTSPGRHVHSLHGYFMRPGDTRESIRYEVEHPRDGGSFSTRIVRAIQRDEPIFMMTCSFAADDPGPEHQFTQPVIAGPDAGRSLPLLGERRRHIIDNLQEYDYPTDPLVELRVLDEDDDDLAPNDGRYERNSWIRVTQELPDDPLIHACALTYVSDLSMVSTALAPHRSQRNSLQVASIDHAVWFHAPIRADQWLHFMQDTPVARNGHGLARALFYAPDGTLVASVMQESLMRTKRPPKDPNAKDFGTVV